MKYIKYLISLFFHLQANQSILSFSLQPTHLIAFILILGNTILFRAVFHLSKHRDIFYHQASKMFQYHASYHSHIGPRTFGHLSIKQFRFHASYYVTTSLHTCDFCTRHKLLNKNKITFSVDLIVQKLTFIIACIQKFQHSFAGLCSISIFSFIPLAIKPLLDAKSVLFIIFPLSNVFGSI